MTTPSDNLLERVAEAARDFCAELCEDADGVPQPELKRLHDALDVWEMVPPERRYDDSTPTTSLLASLKWIVEDGSEPDRVRRAARAAIVRIEASNDLVGEMERMLVRLRGQMCLMTATNQIHAELERDYDDLLSRMRDARTGDGGQ